MLIKLIGLGVILLSVSGCATSTSDSCLIFDPITYSESDTKETKDQIETHNVQWEEICG